MTRATTTEVLVIFFVTIAGTGGMTLAALHYPDNDILQIIGLILTIGALIAVGFYFSRARKKST